MDNSLRDEILALADELRGDDTDDSDLGFIDNPGGNGDTDFVWLNRQEHNRGRMLDENDEPIPFPGDAVAGYVSDIWYQFKDHERYSLLQRLRIALDIEPGTVMLQTNFFTNTSKSLLANLAGVQDPGAKITIEPSLPDDPDESPNVLFTEVYENGKMIQDTNGDWPHEDQDVIDLFHFVREDVFGFEPQDIEPQLPQSDGRSRSGHGRSSSSNGSNNSRNRQSGRSRDENGARKSSRRQRNGQDNGARSSSRRQSTRRKELPISG
jgi:hypothetical protein